MPPMVLHKYVVCRKMVRYNSLIELRENALFDFRVVDPLLPSPEQQLPFAPLDNPIHPIWRREAWRSYNFPADNDQYISMRACDDPSTEICPDIYERLRPALQLATVLLHRAMPFYAIIWRAPIETTPDGNRSFDPHFNPEHADMTSLNAELLSIAREHRILRLPTKEIDVQNPISVHGKTGMFVNTDNNYVEAVYTAPGPPPPAKIFRRVQAEVDENCNIYDNLGMLMPVVCGIAEETLDELAPHVYPGKSALQQASLQLHIAVTLVHELAHAVWLRRLGAELPFVADITDVIDTLIHLCQPEPRMWPETFCELGTATTRYVFGCDVAWPWGRYRVKYDIQRGITNVVRPLVHGKFGLMALITNLNNDKSTALWYRMTDERIVSFFNKYTWTTPRLMLQVLPLDFGVPILPAICNSPTCGCHATPGNSNLISQPAEDIN